MDRRFSFLGHSLSTLLSVSLGACGGSTADDPATDGGATVDSAAITDTALATEGGADAALDGDAPREAAPTDGGLECDALCTARDAKGKTEGWCEPFFDADADGGFTKCADYCKANGAAFSEKERTAFEKCLSTNPLCFESIEACMTKESP